MLVVTEKTTALKQKLDIINCWMSLVYEFIALFFTAAHFMLSFEFFENGIPSVLLKFTGLEKNVGFSIICLVHIYAMTQFQQEFLCL